MSQIRRSQFITTYGPGAILEGKNGPRIIPSVQLSQVYAGRKVLDFEITDQRLPRNILGGAGILRLPSNAEVREPEIKEIYKTKRFPAWSLCTRHHILYRKYQNDNQACPKCPPLPNPSAAWNRASQQAIRFVRACPSGHLDDVEWVKIIHHKQPHCNPDYLNWQGSGALRNIDIECPHCLASINLGLAYSRDWPCSGRFPELEDPTTNLQQHENCSEKARILQRGAANLRICEVQTALTIPKCDTNLHNLLSTSSILARLHPLPTSKSDFLDGLQFLEKQGLLTHTMLEQISGYSETEILGACADIVQAKIPKNAYEMRQDEFHALKDAATHGHPPVKPNRPGDPPLFEILRTIDLCVAKRTHSKSRWVWRTKAMSKSASCPAAWIESVTA